MKKVFGKPITGARPQMRPQAPIKTSQNDTSSQAEALIKKAPAPFTTRFGPGQAPTGNVQQKVEARSKVGVRGLPSGGPVGQGRMPNQSKQIGGRFGTAHPRHKGAGPPGQKVKRGSAFYGES